MSNQRSKTTDFSLGYRNLLGFSKFVSDDQIVVKIAQCEPGLMPSSHCTILAQFFTRRQVLINRRQMPEIGGKSVLVPAKDNRAVWIIKDAIWGKRRHVADARRIFGMLNILSCRRFSILLCEWVLTGSDWKIHRWWPTANERARYRAAGSSRRDFFFFTKPALEYTEQVGYMKMKKGLGFFL